MSEEEPLERTDTAIRLALSLLFVLIAGVVETVLQVLVLFSLGIAFVTRQPPSETVRGFSNQVTTYLYGIYRYLTYNEARAPFPFRPLAPPVESSNWAGPRTEAELLTRSRERRQRRGGLDDDIGGDADDDID